MNVFEFWLLLNGRTERVEFVLLESKVCLSVMATSLDVESFLLVTNLLSGTGVEQDEGTGGTSINCWLWLLWWWFNSNWFKLLLNIFYEYNKKMFVK